MHANLREAAVLAVCYGVTALVAGNRTLDAQENGPPTARITASGDPLAIDLVEGSGGITLDGSDSDDGDSGSQELSYTWEQVSGPESSSIAAPNEESTTVTFVAKGVYVLRLTVDDGLDTATAEITVQVVTRFSRGDVDASGAAEITDAITILTYVYLGTPRTVPCEDALDANDDGWLDISDPIHLLSCQFLWLLPNCHESCGVDPTDEDGLDCESSTCE